MKYETGLFPMCGDILHAGHVLALEEANKYCNTLIVALNTHPDDKFPVQSVFERYIQLYSVKWIDRIIPYQGKSDLEKLVQSLDYQVRFLGDDYVNKDWDGKAQELERGIEPYFIGRKHGFSSTELKERICK